MRILLVIYIATWVFYQNQAKRDFRIELDTISINITGPTIVKFVNSRIYNRKSVVIEFVLHKPIRDLNLKVTINLFKKSNKPMNLLNVNINECKGFRNPKVQFVREVMQQLNRISNLPLKDCVVLANTLYYIRNYTINDDDFPPFILLTSWSFAVEFYSGKNPAAIGKITGGAEKI